MTADVLIKSKAIWNNES